jgi:hypothetical protein
MQYYNSTQCKAKFNMTMQAYQPKRQLPSFHSQAFTPKPSAQSFNAQHGLKLVVQHLKIYLVTSTTSDQGLQAWNI